MKYARNPGLESKRLARCVVAVLGGIFSLASFLSILSFCILSFCFLSLSVHPHSAYADSGTVVILPMDMEILPGTSEYLEHSIAQAHASGAKLVVVLLDTPGGMLQTSQDMVKAIFDAPLPVVFYVSPSGGSATSAGVFVTMAAHVAAMAPGTSIGAAHPVMGDGQDIPQDMRTKAENITVAMVKSIAEQRGRNFNWAEKAVKESASLTENEALKEKVIDLVAKDMDDLLKQLKGRKVNISGKSVELGDYSMLPRVQYEISFKGRVINTLANPMVAHILWIGATTGLSLELYNPGAILPGVVGVICLILALAVYQIIPINIGGILLIVVGAILIGLELALPSGILGVAGIISMVLGSIYLVDISTEPGLHVNMVYVVSLATILGSLLFAVVCLAVRSKRRQPVTGMEGIVGRTGKALETVSSQGRVFVEGEIWKAVAKVGLIEKDTPITVTAVRGGLLLEVMPSESKGKSS